MKSKFIYIQSAYFFHELGKAMYMIVVAWLLYAITKDAFYSGLLVSIGFIPGLILNLVIGNIVDILNRKYLALSANVISALDMLLILFVIYTGIVKPWMIMGVHMLLQVMGSLFRISMQTYLSEGFKKDELPKVLTMVGVSSQIGAMIGSSLGGIIVAFLSMTSSMSVVIVSFLIATFSVYFTRLNINNEFVNKKNSSIFSSFVDGFAYLKVNRFLFGLFSVSFVGQMVFHNSIYLLPVYTSQYLNESSATYGFLDATISTGGIIAGIFGSIWWKKSGKFVVTLSLIVIFLGLFSIGMSPILPISFIGAFLIGLGTTWVRVFIQTIQQLATDPEYRGRVSSYRILFNQGSVVISGPILGWLSASYGINIAYLALLIPITIIILFSLSQLKQKRFLEIIKNIF